MTNMTPSHSEQLDLREVIETIPALVMCARSDGSVELVNRAWQEYTGYSLEQPSESTWQGTIHPEDRARFIDEWSAALSAGKLFETEARVRRADGRYRWFLVKKALAVFRMGDHKPSLGTLIAFEDIDERKQAEQAREEIEEQWRAAFESNPTMYFIVDSTGAIVTVNIFAAEEMGYTTDELRGKPMLNAIYEPDREAVKNHISKCFEQPGRTVKWETRKIRKDGTILWVREKGHAVFLKKRPVLLVVCEDIREQKRAEEATQQSEKQRQQSEEEREKLRQQLAHLAHLDRVSTIGQLTASLAHEIKQPIGAAVTNAEAFLRLLDRDPPDLAEAREAALEIAKDARRAADIIDRVRTLYQKGSPLKEMVDTNDVIREMIEMLRDKADEHFITMRANLASGLPKVMADRVQLQQALMNLMLNGIEAMQDTAGELSVESQRGEDGQVLISVADTGVGLPDGDADRIFDVFVSTKSQGTGLGLAITRSIIESHGGRIWATPNSGRGATFHFTLPNTVAVTA